MANFSLSTVAHIVSELGFSASRRTVRGTVSERQARDAGYRHWILAHWPDRIRAGESGMHGIRVEVNSAVVADPPESVVLAAAEAARRNEIDMLVGFGGGRSLDVAKLVAVLAGTGQTRRRYTAQEMPAGAVCRGCSFPRPLHRIRSHQYRHRAGRRSSKMGVVAPQLYADIAVLDATLTTGLPPAITAVSSIDAMMRV